MKIRNVTHINTTDGISCILLEDWRRLEEETKQLEAALAAKTAEVERLTKTREREIDQHLQIVAALKEERDAAMQAVTEATDSLLRCSRERGAAITRAEAAEAALFNMTGIRPGQISIASKKD